jgi:hypothetical protein
VKGSIESTDYEVEPIALCDSLLWMMIVARASWSLAPFFFCTQGRRGNLLCDGQFHCHGTYNTEA